jgi:hypothetical protein
MVYKTLLVFFILCFYIRRRRITLHHPADSHYQILLKEIAEKRLLMWNHSFKHLSIFCRSCDFP